MEGKQLQQYRVKLFRDATNFIRPERVPHYANIVTWKVFDAGFSLNEAFTDFNVMKKVVEKFLDTYTVDALIDVGIRNQFNVTSAFSKTNNYYYYNEDCVGVHDHAYCDIDTLNDYLKDVNRYVWEVALPKKYPDFKTKPLSVWQNAFDEYTKYIGFILKINTVTKKYGIPSAAPNNPMSGAIDFGIETLEANLLGIKNLSVAMRRNYSLIKDFVDKWDEANITPVIEKIKAAKSGADMKYCFDSSIVMLSHNILNPKQFENLYWCHFKPLLMAYSEKNKNVRIFAEGAIARFNEYFSEIPRGTLCIHLENDDIFSLRKALPNAALMGGLSNELLYNATPSECVDYTKRLIDELGAEGGFMLSEGKMLSYRNDAKAENFKAICDFVSSYNK